MTANMTEVGAEEIVERVKSYIHDHPDVLHDPDHWIEGMGWDQTRWQNEEFPKAVTRLLFRNCTKDFHIFSRQTSIKIPF